MTETHSKGFIKNSLVGEFIRNPSLIDEFANFADERVRAEDSIDADLSTPELIANLNNPSMHSNAWQLIQKQIKTLQSKMKKHGIQTIETRVHLHDLNCARNSYLDLSLNTALLSNDAKVSEKLDSGKIFNFGKRPASIRFDYRNDNGWTLEVIHFDRMDSIKEAASKIFNNIAAYIQVAYRPASVPSGFDFHLDTDDEIRVGVSSGFSQEEPYIPWKFPNDPEVSEPEETGQEETGPEETGPEF